jgi:AcrR family transcriptional regulator
MDTAKEKEAIRLRRTRPAIQQAFISLLHETDFHSISASALMRRAGYSRGTFYLHFLDVWDIFEQTLQEYVEDLLSGFAWESLSDEFSEAELTLLIDLDILRTIQKWYPFGKALLNKRGVPDLLPEIMRGCIQKEKNSRLFPSAALRMIPSGDDAAEALVTTFGVFCFLGLFEWGACRVTPETTEEELIRLAESFCAGTVTWVNYEKSVDPQIIVWNNNLAKRYQKMRPSLPLTQP